MDIDQVESIPDMSGKFGGFRYYLRDLWEPYKEGRLTMDRVANATASRIANRLLPVADQEEKKHLIMICKMLREAVYGVRDYDRVMKKILG